MREVFSKISGKKWKKWTMTCYNQGTFSLTIFFGYLSYAVPRDDDF